MTEELGVKKIAVGVLITVLLTALLYLFWTIASNFAEA